uniref:PH domain-containing protein n=1 Tax=Anopheles coluzzii TaxID=1518534 RepID=A0A8W7P5D0_ANOCL
MLPETQNRCIELHSPDGIHSCILRAMDPQEATTWFNALHSAIGKSTQKALLDANRALVSIIGELKHIGWLSRRSGGEQIAFNAFRLDSRKHSTDEEGSILSALRTRL